jgi:hypothetical protein
MKMENKIQIYNFETTLTKEFLTNEVEVEKFLSQIRSLKDIAFDLSNKEVVKEVKELKKQANKSVKVLKEVCAPYEAEGKKIANIRSSISTTLASGKNNVIDEILQPILEAEAELKKLEETHITSLDLYYVDVKLKELENLLKFNWLIYKDEALGLIKSLKNMALLRKEALEKEEKEATEKAELARKEREEAIRLEAEKRAKEQAQKAIDEANKRAEIAEQKVEEIIKPVVVNSDSDVEHKRKIHNEILNALLELHSPLEQGYVCVRDVIKAVARGNIPNLFIKY